MQLKMRPTHATWNDSKARHLEFLRYQYYALTLCMFREIFFVLTCRVCGVVKYWSCHEQLGVHNEHFAGFQTQFKKSNYRCHARKHVDQNVITNNYSRWETKGEEKNHKNNFIVSYSMTGIFFPSKAIRFVTGHDGNLKQSRIMQLYHNVLSATNHRVALCY